jgi:ribosome-associated protein YbcJ (S4-like RNA binding protein)
VRPGKKEIEKRKGKKIFDGKYFPININNISKK